MRLRRLESIKIRARIRVNNRIDEYTNTRARNLKSHYFGRDVESARIDFKMYINIVKRSRPLKSRHTFYTRGYTYPLGAWDIGLYASRYARARARELVIWVA